MTGDDGHHDEWKDEWVDVTLGRQVAVLEELRSAAVAASGPEERGVGWLAARRHAERRLRSLEQVIASRGAEPHRRALQRHHAALEETLAQADAALTGVDPALLRAARGRLGVAVAVMGKGGVGKSVIAATLARLLARRGRRVLSADLDPNPGLAYSLGGALNDHGLPAEALDHRDGAYVVSQLAPGLHPVDAVERFCQPAPDGVRYLGVGKIADPERQEVRQTVGALFQVLFNFGVPGWDVIGDLEAGTTTPYQGHHFFADRAVVVVGPCWASALTARRLLTLLGGVPAVVVASKVRGGDDHPGLWPEVRIPFDPAVAEAERLGRPPIEHCHDGPAVTAIGELADRLVAEEALV